MVVVEVVSRAIAEKRKPFSFRDRRVSQLQSLSQLRARIWARWCCTGPVSPFIVPLLQLATPEKKANLVSTGNFLVYCTSMEEVSFGAKTAKANCTVRNETTVTLLLDLRPLPTFLLIENPRLPWNSIICRDGANFPPSRNSK